MKRILLLLGLLAGLAVAPASATAQTRVSVSLEFGRPYPFRYYRYHSYRPYRDYSYRLYRPRALVILPPRVVIVPRAYHRSHRRGYGCGRYHGCRW